MRLICVNAIRRERVTLQNCSLEQRNMDSSNCSRRTLIALLCAIPPCVVLGSIAGMAQPPLKARLLQIQSGLGLRLLAAFSVKDPGKTIQASPASLAAVFSYLHLGADDATRRGIETMLGFTKDEGEPAVTELRHQAAALAKSNAANGPLAFANAMFVKELAVLVPGGKELLVGEGMDCLVADIATVQGVDTVNEYVGDHTAQLIPKLLRGTFPDAIAVAINTLYFKDKWIIQFDPKLTQSRPFQRLDGTTVDCQMMSLKTEVDIRESDEFIGVRLSYATPGFSLFLVTTKITPAAADRFVGMSEWFASDSYESQLQVVHLPRFAADTYRNDLLPVLAAFGLQNVNLPKILGPVNIDQVIQQCVIKVNEEGTEAAAATAVIMTKSLAPMKRDIFFDKPFVYALVDETRGVVLLTGYIAEPEGG